MHQEVGTDPHERLKVGRNLFLMLLGINIVKIADMLAQKCFLFLG